MRASIFVGDIAEVTADAICTSTNPRLSLVMGTGAAVRGSGGYEILRACEEIVAREGPLPPGTAWSTTAGALESKVVIHCVASDALHRSSEAIIASCVANALTRAESAGCRTIAMPLFATGHAHMSLRQALTAMARAVMESRSRLDQVIFVMTDEEELDAMRRLLQDAFGGDIPVQRSETVDDTSFWAGGNPFG